MIQPLPYPYDKFLAEMAVVLTTGLAAEGDDISGFASPLRSGEKIGLPLFNAVESMCVRSPLQVSSTRWCTPPA